MFRDSLQKRLQEMERESPSPSLEIAKPTLKERVGFLGGYLSRAVEQVPQRSSIYGSLDDQLNDYKSAVEFEGHIGQGQYWVNKAFEEARNGETWNEIESDLRIASKYSRESGTKLDVDMDSLKSTYKSGIKAFGPKKAEYWRQKAGEELSKGLPQSDIDSSLRIARKYASEAGMKFQH